MPVVVSSATRIRFSEEDYIPEIRLFPDCVDAVEGINATHESPASMSHKNILYNEKAIAYAKEHGLPITAGSDQHTTRMIGGGMLFDRKLSDEKDFCRAVLAGEAKAYWNGSEFYWLGGTGMCPVFFWGHLFLFVKRFGKI